MENIRQPKPARLVITGGPGSGKTDFFERLRTEPDFSGFVMFEDLARTMLDQYPQHRQNRLAFHRELYRRLVGREQAVGATSYVADRGTVDAFAYHPESAADVGTTIEAEYKRYTGVVQLGSAAALGEQYYGLDAVRIESVPEALVIEENIRRVWKDHPGYVFVEAMVDMERKYQAFLETMRRLARRT